MSLESSASISQPSSMYIVARNFGESIFIQSTTASILYSNSGSCYLSYGSPKSYLLDDNNFHIYSIIQTSSAAAELYVNGDYIDTQNIGNSSIDKLIIGKKLRGDISAIVAYSGINSYEDRHRIENWLSESFSIPVLTETKPISYYSASYTNEY